MAPPATRRTSCVPPVLALLSSVAVIASCAVTTSCAVTETVARIDGAGGFGGSGGSTIAANGGAGGTASCALPRLMCGDSCINPLSDADHCGSCNNDCLGQPCDQGECRPTRLANGLNLPIDMLVDDSDAFVVSWGLASNGRGLVRIPLDGGPESTVVNVVGDVAHSLAGDADTLYVAANSGGSYIFAVAKTAALQTPPAPLLTLAAGLQASAMAVDDTHLFWLRNDGAIERMPKLGGAVQQLAAGTADDEPGRLLLHGNEVYATIKNAKAGGRVVRVAKDGGGGAMLIAGAQDHPHGMWIDGSTLYFCNQGAPNANGDPTALTGALMQLDLSQPSATAEPLISGQNRPYNVTVHNGFVYWGTVKAPLNGEEEIVDKPITGRVVRRRLSADNPRVLSQGHVLPFGMEVVDGALIYVDNPNGLGGGAVYRYRLD